MNNSSSVISHKEAVDVWTRSLSLPSESGLNSSFQKELLEYFPKMNPQQINDYLSHSREKFAALWHKSKVDVRSQDSLNQFYNSTELEIFDLLNYHSVNLEEGPLNYVAALYLAKERQGRTYLDYGSGVGAGALVFSKEGFKVTLGDIADPLLAFARWRLDQRSIKATYVDLKTEEPKGPFDIITCFEVLEHVKDPLGLLRKLHSLLVPGGLLCVSAPFWEEDDHPMHIVHDLNLTKKFRAQGFENCWSLKDKVRSVIKEPFFVLKRVDRSMLANKVLEIYDYYIPDYLKSMLRFRKMVGHEAHT